MLMIIHSVGDDYRVTEDDGCDKIQIVHSYNVGTHFILIIAENYTQNNL